MTYSSLQYTVFNFFFLGGGGGGFTGSVSFVLYIIYQSWKPVGRFTMVLGGVSVLQACKFNTNNAIKFHKCFGKKIVPNFYQKMFFNILKKTRHAQENCCLISFKQVRITNDISDKTYRSAESK